jgi:hypothetical protein
MTPRRVPERRRRPAADGGERVGERLIAIFCLGAVLFSPLVIGIFDRGAGVGIFGLPLLYFYFFASWALLIVLLAWVIERPAGGWGVTPAEPSRERSGRGGGVR